MTQKELLRARWHKNESNYLREQKIDVSAFVKLETIGHGTFSVVSCKERQASELAQAMSGLNSIFPTPPLWSILHAGRVDSKALLQLPGP